MSQQVRSRLATGDRAARCTLLPRSMRPRTASGAPLTLAAATGFLDPGDLDYLHLRGDHVQQFADILTHHT